MTYAADRFDTIATLPAWVTLSRADTPEDVAFLSGAALSHLDVLLQREDVPFAALRQRLALQGAASAVAQMGRVETASALRDAVAFLQPGDHPGPAGAVFLAWRHAVARPITVAGLAKAMPDVGKQEIANWLDAGHGAPVVQAAAVFARVRETRPQDLATALLLADCALARALRWPHVMPLLALALRRKDLGQTGDDLHRACHRAVVSGAAEVVREAADLTRRAARLHAVAPNLRAKGADAAVAMFLREEAVAPKALVSLRSDRAARRFCDRLEALGAVRELTGRETFRLYGL